MNELETSIYLLSKLFFSLIRLENHTNYKKILIKI